MQVGHPLECAVRLPRTASVPVMARASCLLPSCTPLSWAQPSLALVQAQTSGLMGGGPSRAPWQTQGQQDGKAWVFSGLGDLLDQT